MSFDEHRHMTGGFWGFARPNTAGFLQGVNLWRAGDGMEWREGLKEGQRRPGYAFMTDKKQLADKGLAFLECCHLQAQ